MDPTKLLNLLSSSTKQSTSVANNSSTLVTLSNVIGSGRATTPAVSNRTFQKPISSIDLPSLSGASPISDPQGTLEKLYGGASNNQIIIIGAVSFILAFFGFLFSKKSKKRKKK